MARISKKIQASSLPKRTTSQKKWLNEKYALFLNHQLSKTLGQFFPSLYEEYFEKWPPVPTEKILAEMGGDPEIATAAVRQTEENRIYRSMHNRTRSKHGVKGQGSSKDLNLTGGPPKMKAALQAYVKYYWEAKIKQAVIDKWAPTPETDLFRETDNGEDQVPWEAMGPMEKNIPLWFRMKVAHELWNAESEDVKNEVDRRRRQEKEDAISTLTMSTTFKTDEGRLATMKRFDQNFSKLSNALTNLCKNVHRDFGFHTTIIVGGPIVRDGGRLGTFMFETPGTTHKQLTFSEFCGDLYETEVSPKFIEYLRLCFPKDIRQLYTLGSISDIASVVPPSLLDPAPSAVAQPAAPKGNVGLAGTEIDAPAIATNPPDATPVAGVIDDSMSDCTPPDIPDVDMVDPVGEVTPDEPVPTSPDVLPTPVTSVTSVQVATSERGIVHLTETPPGLLEKDGDVRPEWLMIATKSFLHFAPYFGGLGRAVDLFLMQEARLGYPQLSRRLALPSSNRPTEIASFMKWGRDYSRGDEVEVEAFGAAVIKWWLTIQPTTRKEWPPVYDNALPDDFSFDYFNRGGPNGTFLVILCLCWWANALTPETDFTDFDLIVKDVCWVFEQVAAADLA